MNLVLIFVELADYTDPLHIHKQALASARPLLFRVVVVHNT